MTGRGGKRIGPARFSQAEVAAAHGRLRRKGATGELKGPCPSCGGEDRFWVNPDGHFCCRGCLMPFDRDAYNAILDALGLASDGPRGESMPDDVRNAARAPRSVPQERDEASGGPNPPAQAAKPAGAAQAAPQQPIRKKPRPDYSALAEFVEKRGRLRWLARLYLERRGLDVSRLAQAGWRSIDKPEQWQTLATLARRCGGGLPSKALPNGASGHALLIPQRNRDGRPSTIRIRAVPDGPVVSLPGDTGRIYNAPAFTAPAGSILHVAEGEIDCESLRLYDALAVGLPGVRSLHPLLVRQAVEMAARMVVIWFDPDRDGREAGEKLRDALREAGIPVRRLIGHDGDCNDLLLAGKLQEFVQLSETPEERKPRR